MAEDYQTFELIRLLDLPEGTPLDERLWRWAEAFDAWLEGRCSGYHPSVGTGSHHAWREFLAFTGKAPWEVSVEEVNAYIRSLEKRGLRPKTINSRLAWLGSFYAYCQEKGVDAWWGAGFNPVKAAQRPKVVDYERVRCLSEGEEAALLLAAQLDDSPISKRDYALILMLLRTGWKSVRVRELRWGDLRLGDGESGGLGEAETGRLRDGECRCASGSVAALRGGAVPEKVGEAIRDYLAAAGRWEGIRDEEYVFAPVKPHLVSERRERAEDWDGERPLTKTRLSAVIRQHARLAGLRAEAITCHTLRHTAALRRLKSGESRDAVAKYLGQKPRWRTREYLRKLEKSPKGRLRSRKRDNRDNQQAPSRKPHRFQRGHHMGLTHGLRSKYLPEFEWLAEQGVRLHPLDAEVLRWRIVIMRATILWEHIETLREACLVLKAVSQATVNLARAIKRRKQIGALARELDLVEELLEGWV